MCWYQQARQSNTESSKLVDPMGSEIVLDTGRGGIDCTHVMLEVRYIAASQIAPHCPAKLVLVAEHSNTTTTALARRMPYVCITISRTSGAEPSDAIAQMP
jgi:hypothetical protein